MENIILYSIQMAKLIKKLPKAITDNLGQPAEKIVETNEEEISELQDQLEKLLMNV